MQDARAAQRRSLTPLARMLEPPAATPSRPSHDHSEVASRRRSGSRRTIRRGVCARSARPHGERHPRARDGRGRAGEIRPSRPADGRGRHRDRAVHPLSEVRSRRSVLARPRPLRALGRPRLDADLLAAASARLRADDHRGAQALPPDGLDHARPSGELRDAGARDHDRPARPGTCQRGRHGDRRAASRVGVRRHRRSLYLRARLRRRPDGGHQPGGDRARRPPQAQPADRAVRRQRYFDRWPALARRLGRPGEALRVRRLGGDPHRRP